MKIPSKIIYSFNSIIPTAFDDSLSYYEVLTKLIYKVNELISVMETYSQDYKSYTDEQITIVKLIIETKYRELIKYCDDNKLIIENKIVEQIQIIRNEYTKAINELTLNLHSKLNTELFTINNKLNKEVLNLYAKITEEKENIINYINNTLIDFKVIDSTTGLVTGIQDALNNITNLMKQTALTVSEFEALNYSVAVFDGKQISAYDYDFKGKTILN